MSGHVQGVGSIEQVRREVETWVPIGGVLGQILSRLTIVPSAEPVQLELPLGPVGVVGAGTRDRTVLEAPLEGRRQAA